MLEINCTEGEASTTQCTIANWEYSFIPDLLQSFFLIIIILLYATSRPNPWNTSIS